MNAVGSDAKLILFRKGDVRLADAFMEMGEDYMSQEPEEMRDKFLRSVLELQGGEGRWLYFLKLGGEVVGFTHINVDTTDRPGWGWLLEHYIRPQHRMKGWGRYLFEGSTEEFRRRGISDLWLTSNPEAVGFWKAMGFKETGEVADFNNYAVMVKRQDQDLI